KCIKRLQEPKNADLLDIVYTESKEKKVKAFNDYLKKEDVYYTSVKTAIVMLEANGILTIDNDHNAMLTRKGKRYIEINERELVDR
ncbi:MAG: hypothetical protein KH405_07400, partial [Firmicutes bacterium]|nr:hypothetical protein [Bacillota bacterium]